MRGQAHSVTPGKHAHRAALGLALLLSTGCATDYVARTRAVRDAYQSYDHQKALRLLDEKSRKGPEDDQLLVLLDRGMILHAAARYEESIRTLAEAERLAQQLDVVSVSEEAATLLTSERERAYRGEDFEKLMISVLQALNYAQLGKDEDALVEVRRVNERIRKMISEEKKPYEQLAIARYLGAVLYEDQREWDSAFIDYHSAAKLSPGLGHLAEPLLRLAKLTGRTDAFAELSAKYPGISAEPLRPDEGQLVVVVENGLAPEKVTFSRRHSGAVEAHFIAVPSFCDRWRPNLAEVAVAGQRLSAVAVTSLEDVAKIHLDDRVGRLVAKQLAGVAVKAGVAASVGALTRSEGVGALAFWLLALSNQPDLRSWLSLPAEFQVARLRLPAGEHTVEVTAGGATSGHRATVRPGRISLVVVRRY